MKHLAELYNQALKDCEELQIINEELRKENEKLKKEIEKLKGENNE